MKALVEALLRLGRGQPRCRVESLTIADLGRAFEGYTIAVLSDLHHAPWAGPDSVRHVVNVTNAASPDLVALLGDYGASFKRAPRRSRRWYERALASMGSELGRLQSRDGVVAVLGNHDYYAGASYVREWLCGLGASVLVNDAHRIVRSGDALRVAGVDDFSEGAADPWAGCRAGDETPTIVLSHNPDAVMRIASNLRVDLMLAGHTHGGQIVVPGFGAPVTMARVCGPRTASGWVQAGRTPLYVTRGLGVQLPVPVRINCPPEILLFRLYSGLSIPGRC